MMGRIALVTGANRGIGLEVCRQLSRAGAEVILAARDEKNGREAVAVLAGEGLAAIPFVLDVTRPASIDHARGFVANKFGRLDVLVNNAGGGYDFLQTPLSAKLDDARATFELNLFGPWALVQAFAPLLKASGRGRVVNVSSGAGSWQDPAFGIPTASGTAAYAASKAALNALTAKFAAELKGSGVLVNAVCPGFTATFPGAEKMGARPVAEGASGVVWAAALPDDGPAGGFFRDGRPLGW